jgi:signal transduction histidine kinase
VDFFKKNTVIASSDLKTPLLEIRQSAAELYRFTEKLTLLKIVNQVAIQIIKAVDTIQKEINALSGDALLDVLEASKSALFLEDVVDDDMMSELEAYVLPFAKNLDNDELTRFLSEVTDKIEIKYNAMLEKIHEFNAIVKDELE